MADQNQNMAEMQKQLDKMAKKLGMEENNPQKLDVIGLERAPVQKIIMPEGMSLADAEVWIRRRREEEEKVVAVHEVIKTHPFDGAVAFVKALREKFGWVDQVPTPGFWGSRPPHMLSIEVAYNKFVQVPWGRFQIPGMEGYLSSSIEVTKDGYFFAVAGEIKHKHRVLVTEICELARKIVDRESIYKGKAITVAFPDDFNPRETSPEDVAPKFMNLHGIDDRELVLPGEVEALMQTNLFTPVERTEECRQLGIPLKRGVLLAGSYGVGKTMSANILAKKCEAKDWTFIYLKSVKHLEHAITFAMQYQPACIFSEDIDQVTRGDDEDRDEAVNDILNTLDGILSKGKEIMVVLTSNHAEKINPAMLRPGRLDAVIVMRPPDAKAVERLVTLYARDLMVPGTDLSAVGKRLAGQRPAIIREVVERAKLAAIGRLPKGTAVQSGLSINEQDILVTIDGMQTHIDLMNGKAEKQEQYRVSAVEHDNENGEVTVVLSTTQKKNGVVPARA
jgi:transitional endoplasmic reticulum ATPase